MSRIWVTSLPSFSSGEVERAKYVSACENCHTREKRDALHLPCGWWFSRALAYFARSYHHWGSTCGLFPYRLRVDPSARFTSFFRVSDPPWLGAAFSSTATGNRASLILYRAQKFDIIIRNCYSNINCTSALNSTSLCDGVNLHPWVEFILLMGG